MSFQKGCYIGEVASGVWRCHVNRVGIVLPESPADAATRSLRRCEIGRITSSVFFRGHAIAWLCASRLLAAGNERPIERTARRLRVRLALPFVCETSRKLTEG